MTCHPIDICWWIRSRQWYEGKLMKFYKRINSLTPEKYEWNVRYVIFKRVLVIAGWGMSCEIALIWMSLDFTDDQSTLVQVMAWCRQAIIHYLRQCWPRALSPYDVTRPQWAKRDMARIYIKCYLVKHTNAAKHQVIHCIRMLEKIFTYIEMLMQFEHFDTHLS